MNVVALPHVRKPLRPSLACVEFTGGWEGFRAVRYKCQAGIWTIGFGHIGHFAQVEGYVMTEAQAKELLLIELDEAADEVNRLVKVSLTQSMFDALVSWQYNTGGLATSTLLKRLNKGEYDAVDDEMRRWDKIRDPKTGKHVVSRGLKRRRQAEAMLWDSGVPVQPAASLSPEETNPIPVEPENEQLKPIPQTKTVIGATVSGSAGLAAAGEMLSDSAETASKLANPGTWLAILIALLIIGGVALTIYGKIDARRRGGV